MTNEPTPINAKGPHPGPWHADVQGSDSQDSVSQGSEIRSGGSQTFAHDAMANPEVLGLAESAMGRPVETFEAFYVREFRNIVVLAYALCGSTGMAEDVAQEACIAALRRWDSLTNPDAWVRRVVANKSVSSFRRRAVEAKGLLMLRSAPGVETVVTPETSELWGHVRKLPKRQAQVIALRYIDGATAAEIAEVLEVSENTVKTHLKRAKQSLSQNASGLNASGPNASGPNAPTRTAPTRTAPTGTRDQRDRDTERPDGASQDLDPHDLEAAGGGAVSQHGLGADSLPQQSPAGDSPEDVQ